MQGNFHQNHNYKKDLLKSYKKKIYIDFIKDLFNKSSMSMLLLILIMLISFFNLALFSTHKNLKHNLYVKYSPNKFQIFLTQNISDDEIYEINSILLKNSNIKDAQFASNVQVDDSLNYFLDEFDIELDLPKNLMPNVFNVNLSERHNILDVKELIADISKISFVDSVNHSFDINKKLTHIEYKILLLLLGVGILIFVILSVILNFSIKAFLNLKIEHMNVFKLIGASEDFITSPYIFISMILCILGGLFSFVLYNASFFYMKRHLLNYLDFENIISLSFNEMLICVLCNIFILSIINMIIIVRNIKNHQLII